MIMAEKAIIIDGNSLMHRAFHALPPTMKRKDGAPTGAVYGFFNMLFRMIGEYRPDYLAVAFDVKKETFRNELFAEYKAGRKKTPDELIVQFSLLKEALNGLKIAMVECEGFEADDILGTISRRLGEEKDIHTFLLTGDRDSFQLISPKTSVLMTRKGVSEIELFDEVHLKEIYGLHPSQIIDLKSLMGDSSDNIPGVPGVGEKTALKLLASYSTLEELYDHLEELPKNKLYEKLHANRDLAFLSKQLATINTQAPIETTDQDIRFGGLADNDLAVVLRNLEFFSLLKRFSLQETGQPQTTTNVLSETIENSRQLDIFLREIQTHKSLGLCMTDDALSLAVNVQSEKKIVMTVSLLGESLAPDHALQQLKPILEDENIKKIAHDAKGLMHYFADAGIGFAGLAFDTMVAEYVINPTRRVFSLEKLCEYYSASGQAAALFQLKQKQEATIKTMHLEEVFRGIEMPLLIVLFQMEQEGFAVNLDELRSLGDRYLSSIHELSSEIYSLAGTDGFNIASTKQLGTILFEKLGLPYVKKTKTGYSTDIEVLEKLQDLHPIIPKIIEYRQLTKLQNTYIDGLLAAAKSVDHKIHTTFKQTATATGRISSTEPNLQNIPVRSEFSAEIRRAFIPSRPENRIVSADYSQIELRVLAHISGDEHMCSAFRLEEDIHTRTAAEVFDVELDEVTPMMRSSAKAVNFGIVYGISDFGLARNLGIPRYKAQEYIQKYLNEFSGVRQYMHDIVEQAKKDGYVRTMLGRIRYVDELKSSNHNMRAFGERVALNTPIQGTAADIIKLAMIEVDRALSERNLLSKLILQVHDELIVDAYPDEVEEIKSILREVMEHVYPLSVPLSVNVSEGRTWADAK